MLGVQIKSNYRQCGPSASLRKDIGDTDGYLMFFFFVFFPSLFSLSLSFSLLQHTIYLVIPSLLSPTPSFTPSSVVSLPLFSLATVAWVSLRTTVSWVPNSVVTAWPSCPSLATCRPAAPTCCSRPPASSTSPTRQVRKNADSVKSRCFYIDTAAVFYYSAVGFSIIIIEKNVTKLEHLTVSCFYVFEEVK